MTEQLLNIIVSQIEIAKTKKIRHTQCNILKRRDDNETLFEHRWTGTFVF